MARERSRCDLDRRSGEEEEHVSNDVAVENAVVGLVRVAQEAQS